jgi:hypothetical protein
MAEIKNETSITPNLSPNSNGYIWKNEKIVLITKNAISTKSDPALTYLLILVTVFCKMYKTRASSGQKHIIVANEQDIPFPPLKFIVNG